MGLERAFLSMAQIPRRMGEQEGVVLEVLNCRARVVDDAAALLVLLVALIAVPPPPALLLSTMMDLKGDATDHIIVDPGR